ncbi:phosphate ABC transporter permease [Arthrobacter sp. UCD-GKA]|uniref:ABC transporter permease n=1 Tax=Arthrobacter sp. UCD-GKA TaxID=1913576 RepID=UPI0008DE9475|nr:ABC transporter permease [Arthrobacter sp. UCD-GKA]OIH83670.1 phosphate ABC transporter permease [Arthrobacter sp. UCD-GKA]
MTAAEYAAQYGLIRVGARPSLASYLKQAWARRDFAYELAKSRLQATNQRNRLGMLWVVIKPTMNALMYGFIFGILQSSKPHDFPVYVVIGVFLFEFFTGSVNSGAKAITGNAALVQSLAFPRITLPIAAVIQQFLTLVPMLGVMFIYCMILGTTPKLSWLMVIPLLVIFTMFNTGIALVCARLTVHVRDFTQILPLITRILFYTSGVLFGVDRILNAFPVLVRMFDFHPIYQALQIARGSIMNGAEYPSFYWIVLSVWGVVALVGGTIYFWAAEERYGRVD